MSERLTRFRQGSAHPNGATGANGQATEAHSDKDSDRDRNNISLFMGMNGLSHPSEGAPALSVSSVCSDSEPHAACACGCGEFHRAPGDPWRCSYCEPPDLPADASALTGWAFVAVPDGAPIPRDPLPHPPRHDRPRVVYLDEVLPDPATAPIGKCVGCRERGFLTDEELCGRCVWERLR